MFDSLVLAVWDWPIFWVSVGIMVLGVQLGRWLERRDR